MAFSTIGLWTETRRAGNRQARDTEASIAVALKAALAADDSARALVSTERARIYVEIERSNLGYLVGFIRKLTNVDADNPKSIGDDKPRVFYVLKNHGKTPALLKEISHAMVFGLLPPTPDYSAHVYGIPASIGAGQAETMEYFTYPGGLTVGEAFRINQAYMQVWFYCRVIYEDSFGVEQRSAFLWEYEPGMEQFYPNHHNKNYNERT